MRHEKELCYMLCQLRSHKLTGCAPGGVQVSLQPDVGIKTGSTRKSRALRHDPRFGPLRLGGASTVGVTWDRPSTSSTSTCCCTRTTFSFLTVTLLDFVVASGSLTDVLLGLAFNFPLTKRRLSRTTSTGVSGRSRSGRMCFEIAKKGETLKVLGLDFSLSNDQSEQAREITARVSVGRCFSQRHPSGTGPLAGQSVHHAHPAGVAVQLDWRGTALRPSRATSFQHPAASDVPCRFWVEKISWRKLGLIGTSVHFAWLGSGSIRTIGPDGPRGFYHFNTCSTGTGHVVQKS